MTMEYGYCTGFSTTPRFQLGTELLGMIRESGFSYVEFPLMRFPSISPEGFSALRRQVEQTGLASPVACNFFPDSVRLVGKSVHCRQIDGYLACVLPRLQELRVKKIVLGSGQSRTFESCQTRNEACSQFKDILANVILPRTKTYGMVVCLEPFPSADCNLIVSGGRGFCRCSRGCVFPAHGRYPSHAGQWGTPCVPVLLLLPHRACARGRKTPADSPGGRCICLCRTQAIGGTGVSEDPFLRDRAPCFFRGTCKGSE